MKKIKLIKQNELAISKERGLYCDFCGESEEGGIELFTSTYDERPDNDERKCEMQICADCVKQLFKLI